MFASSKTIIDNNNNACTTIIEGKWGYLNMHCMYSCITLPTLLNLTSPRVEIPAGPVFLILLRLCPGLLMIWQSKENYYEWSELLLLLTTEYCNARSSDLHGRPPKVLGPLFSLVKPEILLCIRVKKIWSRRSAPSDRESLQQIVTRYIRKHFFFHVLPPQQYTRFGWRQLVIQMYIKNIHHSASS